jgi:hypothetical protein
MLWDPRTCALLLRPRKASWEGQCLKSQRRSINQLAELAIYIFSIVQIYPQYPPIRERQYQNIICNLRRNEVGAYGESELYPLDIEYGQRELSEVLECAGGHIAV